MREPADPGAGRNESGSADGSDPGRTAELIAEEWAGKVARWTVRGLARAKEEAEDIWADAQALRREL